MLEPDSNSIEYHIATDIYHEQVLEEMDAEKYEAERSKAEEEAA